MTNHELARAAAENERLARQAMAMIQAADLSIGGGIKIIRDTYAEAMAERDELRGAAMQAFGALVGAHASDESVQGLARQRLRKILGFDKKPPEVTK
jgi:hypothetical protein